MDSVTRMAVRLVPVQVFGRGDEDGDGEFVYGLADAVQAWSDCNRARGHIYRFDDTDPQKRQLGETLTVWVDKDEYEAFASRVWGDG